jgi:hypothetical protein
MKAYLPAPAEHYPFLAAKPKYLDLRRNSRNIRVPSKLLVMAQSSCHPEPPSFGAKDLAVRCELTRIFRAPAKIARLSRILVHGKLSHYRDFRSQQEPILMKKLDLAMFCMVPVMLVSALAQQASKHVLGGEELNKVIPNEFFYRGQKAPVQLRNAVGFQLADGKMTLASLVDASGYSTAIQQKYQGLLITETKLHIGSSTLSPGQYGFGFTAEGKFMVMDVANSDVLSADFQTDAALQRPVPLKLVEDGEGYKLYAGRKWISIKPM